MNFGELTEVLPRASEQPLARRLQEAVLQQDGGPVLPLTLPSAPGDALEREQVTVLRRDAVPLARVAPVLDQLVLVTGMSRGRSEGGDVTGESIPEKAGSAFCSNLEH